MSLSRLTLAGVVAVALVAALGLGGCAHAERASYYWQSVSGHLGMLGAAQALEQLIQDPATAPALKTRLQLAQQIRQFASEHLHLPRNASYTRYADLKRTAAVWNVVAAPPFSLRLHTWCFVAAGCVSYRGYYKEADALTQAQVLREQGFEVSVYGVPAYSTLGKLDWLGDFGADPLLNTFVNRPDAELARLIFHELAHQVLYVPDDTVFNESFATAVEQLGARQWLGQRPNTQARQQALALRDQRALEFRALTQRTRERLQKVYGDALKSKSTNSAVASDFIDFVATDSIVNEQKAQTMGLLKTEYAELKTRWGGFAGYDAWIANANNASLGSQAAYDELVPLFTAIFERNGQDFSRFYDAIKALVKLPRDQRRAQLVALATP